MHIDDSAQIDPSAKVCCIYRACLHRFTVLPKLGPNVSIGPGVQIGRGARVRDAIILPNVLLQSHSCVINSIVGWSSTVGQWTRVEACPAFALLTCAISSSSLQGAPVAGNPNDPTTIVPAKPLFNKDGRLEPGVTIVGEGVNIADGIIVRNSIVLPRKDLQQSYHNEIIL